MFHLFSRGNEPTYNFIPTDFFVQKRDSTYLSKILHMDFHGNLRMPPECPTHPGNNALLRPYQGIMAVDNPLIRPYFLGVCHGGGTLKFP